jgi:hypothetical protein
VAAAKAIEIEQLPEKRGTGKPDVRKRDKILLGHIGLILLKRLSDDLALLFVGHARWDSQSYLSADMVAFPKWKGESQNDTPLGTGCLVTPSYC